MTDLAPSALLLLGLGIFGFGCFTWGTLRHFKWEQNGGAGAWAISLLSWVGFLLLLWQIWHKPPASLWPVAALLFAAAIGLWFWTIARTRETRPTLAFTGDQPEFLMASGPYGWVRHPFYTAYMTFWIGAALAYAAIAGWVVAAVIGLIYWSAARHEEGKFAKSGYAARYLAYAARTGMFLPRLGRNSSASPQ